MKVVALCPELTPTIVARSWAHSFVRMSCQVQTSSHGACCPSALAVLFSRSVFSQAGRPARGLVAADRWEQAFEALLATV